MRSALLQLTACAFFSLAGVAPTIAQDGGSYASVFGGANFLSDNDFNLRSHDPGITFFSQLDGTMHFDASGAVGGAFGYRWNSVALEAELSGRRGKFDREDLPVGTIPLDGRYDALALMANAYYRLPTMASITPYLGAGAGVAYLSAKVISPDGGPINNLSDTRAALQAIAGISVPLGDKVELGLEYRYFWVDRPDFTVDLGSGATGSANIGFRSNNVLLRASWKFD